MPLHTFPGPYRKNQNPASKILPLDSVDDPRLQGHRKGVQQDRRGIIGKQDSTHPRQHTMSPGPAPPGKTVEPRAKRHVLQGKEPETMQKAWHTRTMVLPGSKIEIVDPELPVRESVSVVVLYSSEISESSAVDSLDEVPGPASRQDRRGYGGLPQGRARSMGSLTLPSAGPVYPDASGCIYSVEHIGPTTSCSHPRGDRPAPDSSSSRAMTWQFWQRASSRCVRTIPFGPCATPMRSV